MLRVVRAAGIASIAVLGCNSLSESEGSASGSTGGGAESSGSSEDSSSTSDAASSSSSSSSSGSSGTDEPQTSSSSGGPTECQPVPSCLAAVPNVGPDVDWEHTESSLVVASGSDRHRGRDMFYNPDDAHWVMAKFAYGATDWDLADERIDMFLLEGCEGEFEFLATVNTTDDGEHPTVEGVDDSGGWVFFEMPRPLPVGRHRVHFVVRGDGTRTDTFIEVVEPGTPIFVSDIDGTLTTFEWERFIDLLLDEVPDINPGAPEAFALLVERGYRPMYLTARPEFLGKRTYEFIAERGLPPGIIHTTLNATGALGSAAVEFKSGEFAALAARGLDVGFVFGNTDSDSETYDAAGILPLEHRIFVEFDDPRGGRRIDSYTELAAEFSALPLVCD